MLMACHDILNPFLYTCDQPITVRYCFFIPPENIKKTFSFSYTFRGYSKAIPGCNGVRVVAAILHCRN